jgi:hypothetical protein
MNIFGYLKTLPALPLHDVVKYTGGPPKDGIPFEGYPRQHPWEKHKLLLVYDPLGENPTVVEFIIEDVVYVEDIHSAVTESGEGVPLVRLWIRRRAHGVILEPFEVDDPVQFINKIRELPDRFFKSRSS